MAKRPEISHDMRKVIYDDAHWSRLSKLRKRAFDVMSALKATRLSSYVYGSVARGDVSESSDIDIIIPSVVASYKIELAITNYIRRELVQATPSSVLKGHIHLDENTVITFPLFKMMQRERDFYAWGGMVNASQIENDIRVPGVDKRLMLIEPTKDGHIESGVIGHESMVCKKLDVAPSIAQERVRVLTRRDTVGRTGVYITRALHPDESFEEVAKQLQDEDPALRRTIMRREG